jgi:type IV pilus assembly protein PilM
MASFHSIFAHLFPPPHYLSMPAVGVDVSDTSLKYIRLARHRDTFSLASWGDVSIPEGVIEKGNVQNVAGLAKVLRTAADAAKTPWIRMSLPEELAYLFETKVKASLSEQEIYSALEFRLEENVPLSPRDAEFDYQLLGTANGEQAVVVTVYAKDTVHKYHEACRMAGVTPLSFEVEAQALARAVVRTGDTHASLVVDFGKTRTGVGVVRNGVLTLTSTIDIGGNELDSALKKVYPKANAETLITLKNRYGILASHDEPEARQALLGTVTTLKNEINTRIGYWNTRFDDASLHIKEIILCGGIANLAGLPDFLTEGLQVPVTQANVWRNAFSVNATVPPITKRYSYGYATAVGLALASFNDDV